MWIVKLSAQPLVIAHRGVPGLRLEHTRPSYDLAIDTGADYIEPDVVASRDGQLVVRHENEIGSTTDIADHPEFADRRTTKTVDGVEKDGWFTEDFTLEELKGLRVRERIPALRPHNSRFDGQFEIPALGEVIELARRLGVGLANVDTFAREHTIAETLQRSVLPGILPAIPGLDLAVSYLPATEGADVGGDWYDAFPVSRGRVGLVTGDVAGHNIASAAVMGQVRSVLRAYAMHRPHPGRVLQRTNTALVRLLPEALVSVVYAVLNPATGLLGYANAGHPPPIVITGTGETEYLDDTVGVMLGACTDARFTTGYRRLPPGTGLLCYTDGLIEHRNRDISEGLAALAETLHRSAGRSAEQTCATVQAALLGTAERADDVCLLAARLTG